MYDIIKIYQLRPTDDNREARFVSLMNTRIVRGRDPKCDDYVKVYEIGRAALGIIAIDPETILERVYNIFNINKPADFKGHSLSVSDVVTLNGVAYYVDTFGFKKLRDFDVGKNYKTEKDGQLKFI